MSFTNDIRSTPMLRLRWFCGVLLAMAILAAAPRAAAAASIYALEGISDGQHISGKVRIYARVAKEPSRVTFTMLFPDGSREVTVRREWPWSLALSDDGRIGAWDSTVHPEGTYVLNARVYQGNRVVDGKIVRFVVDQSAPAQTETDLQGVTTDSLVSTSATKVIGATKIGLTGALPTTHTIGESDAINFSLDAPLAKGQDVLVLDWSEAQKGMVESFSYKITGKPYKVDNSHLDALPIGRNEVQLLLRQDSKVLDQTRLWIDVKPATVVATSVSIAADAPTEYQAGQIASVGFALNGELGDGQDVLVIAWSDEKQAMVSGVSQTFTAPPFVIPSSLLAKLPDGRNQLQVMLRHHNKTLSQANHWIEVVPVVQAAQHVSFAADAPSQHTVGTNTSVSLNLDGELVDGQDLLVLAWSDSQATMVSSFAYSIGQAPLVISAAKLDSLPAGRCNLQVVLRQNDSVVDRADMWIDIVNPDVIDSSGSQTPTDSSNTTDSTNTTDSGSSTGTTTTDPQPEPLPQVSLSFDDTNPVTHTIGDNDYWLINVEGNLPASATMLISAVQDDGAIVSAFTHTLSWDSDRITQSKLDLLPAGRDVITAQIVYNDQVLASVSRALQVTDPTTATDTPYADDGTRTPVSNFKPEAGKTYRNLLIRGGVRVVWQTINNVTFENCDFRDAAVLLTVQSREDGSDNCSGWTFRNCTFVGATRSDWGHSHGAFLEGVHDFQFIDCTFEHNGYLGTQRFNQNHHVYLCSPTKTADNAAATFLNQNITFTRCKFIDAAAQGVKCLGFKNLTFDSCYFQGNLIDIGEDDRSPGSNLMVKNCTFEDTGGTDSIGLTYGWSIDLEYYQNPLDTATISNCVWKGGLTSGPGFSGLRAIKVAGNIGSVLVENPNFDAWNGDTIINQIGDRLRVVEGGSLITPLFD